MDDRTTHPDGGEGPPRHADNPLGLTPEAALRLTKFSLDHAAESVVWIRPDATYAYANDAACRQVGYSRHELLGKSVMEINPALTPAIWAARWEQLKRDRTVRYEAVLLAKDGRRVMIEATLDYVAFEGREYAFGFGHDVTEQRHSEAALRASEEHHRALVEGLPDIVARVDRDGRCLFVSANISDLLGLPAEYCIGKTLRELGYPEEDCRVREQAVQRVFDTGTAFETELTMRGKRGTMVIGLRLWPERDSQGVVQSVLSLNRDITAQRQAEENYRTLFREMLDGFALHEIVCDERGQPVDYRFLAVNPAFERMTGLHAQELIGRTAREALPGLESHWVETYGTVALTGQPAFFDNYAAGLGKHFEVTAFQPAPGQFACIFADITERKRAAEALRESESRQAAMIANLADVIVIIDEHGLNRYKSPNIERLFGWRPDEVVGRPALDNVHPDDLAFAQDFIGGLLAEPGVSRTAEVRYRCRDGSYKWIEFAGTNMLHDPSIRGILGNYHDISQRKQTEAALRASEERHRAILEGAMDGFLRMDPEGWVLEVNEAYCQMSGRSREQLLSLRNADIDAIESPEEAAAHLQMIRAHGGHRFESRHYRGDGSTFDVEVSVRYEPAKGVLASFIRDITDRKRAEEHLHAVVTNARCILWHSETRGMPGWRHDPENRLPSLMWHFEVADESAAQQVLALDVPEGSSYAAAMGSARLIDDYWASNTAAHSALAAGAEGYEQDYRCLDRAGRAVWLHEKATVRVLGPDHWLIVGVTTDVSARKQAEDEVKRVSHWLKRTQRISKVGGWAIDLRTGMVWASPEAQRIYGTDDAFDYTIAAIQAFALPQYRAALDAALTDLVTDGKPYDVEYQIARHTDGAIVDIHSLAEYDAEAEVVEGVIEDITERKRAEEALNESRARLLVAMTSMTDAVFITDTEGRLLDFNDAFATFHRIANRAECPTSLDGARAVVDLFLPDGTLAPTDQRPVPRALRGETATNVEYALRRKDTGETWIGSYSFAPIRDAEGAVVGSVVTARDVTEQKRAEAEKAELEAQLQQAQKLESVGRLAGGVAHDFNNMLGVILGHTEMAMDQVEQDQPLYGDLVEILQATQRSAALTRQLLAFARKQTIAPEVLDLSHTLASMVNMLQRLIGENVRLRWQPEPDLWPIKLDPSQLNQILANLCVNARDAIADVGTITIETSNRTLDDTDATRLPGIIPGDYVRLVVRDDGCGMDRETMAHLFEPFFTTKDIGKGTGLGLAMVYGAVKQNGGYIHVDSVVGSGTVFAIHLRRHVGRPAQAGMADAAGPNSRGHETILLVEDEPAVLAMTTKMLAQPGYTVLSALTPAAALDLVANHPGDIHLLMTDVVMPDLNGRELSQRVLARRPGIKCLFVSGYTADTIAQHGVLEAGVSFLHKPYSGKTLLAKVADMLGREARPRE